MRLSRTERRAQTSEYNNNVSRAEEVRRDIFETNRENLSLDYYRKRYDALPPELKPFFRTPEEMQNDPVFIKYTSELAQYKEQEKENNAYQHAIRLWQNKISYYWYRGKPEYKYLKSLWDKYGNYDRMIAEREQNAQQQKLQEINKKLFGEGGTWTEFNVVNGKDIPVSQTVYYGGVGYKFDISKMPASEKLIYKNSGDKVEVIAVRSAFFNKVLALEDYKKAVDKYNTDNDPKTLQAQARQYLTDYNTSLNKNPQVSDGLFSNIVKYYNVVRLSTAFGSNTDLLESDAKKINDIRQTQGFGLVVPFAYRNEIIKAYDEKKAMDVKAQDDIKKFNELNEIVNKAPENLKFYVQQEGLNMLGKKGIKTTYDTKTSSFRITTEALPEFEKRVSQDYVNIELLDKANKNPTIKITPPLKMTTIDEKSGYKNPYVIDTGFKPPTMAQYVRGINQFSVRVTEAYFIGKAVGLAFGGIVKGGSYAYKSLGGGLTYEATTTGSTATAYISKSVSVSKTLSESPAGVIWKPAIYSKLVKGTIIAGLTAGYGYTKYQQYMAYQDKYGKYGKELAIIDITGETTGYGIAIGQQMYNQREVIKNNELIKEQNKLREDLKNQYENLKRYGDYSEKASIDYKQAGKGNAVKLSDKQMDDLSKEYAKVTGVSDKEAKTILKEKTFYRVTKSITDTDIPSTKRAIQTYKTGKVTTGDDTLKYSRYGFTDTIETEKGVKEVAFEFNFNSGRISKIKLITTIKEDQYAVSNIFEKVRVSKANPKANMRLKETILTKMDDLKIEQLGDIKVSNFKTTNKILSTYPYGKEKMTLEEVQDIGFDNNALKSFNKLWKKANIGESVMLNTRIQKPIYYKSGTETFRIEDEYKILQSGIGKKDTTLKNIISELGDDYFKDQVKTKLPKKPAVSISDMLSLPKEKPMSARSSALVKDIIKKNALTTSLKTSSVAPLISKPELSYKINLKNIMIEKASTKEALALMTDLGVKTIQKQKLRSMIKEDLLVKDAQITAGIQAQSQKQDLGTKQPLMSFSQSSSQTPISPSPFVMPDIPIPEIPAFDTPLIPPAVIWGFPEPHRKPKLKKLIKGKRITEIAILPDFTSRIIGLEPKSVNLKNLDKEVRAIQTGFEIRSGAKIKGFKQPDLMREIVWQ